MEKSTHCQTVYVSVLKYKHNFANGIHTLTLMLLMCWRIEVIVCRRGQVSIAAVKWRCPVRDHVHLVTRKHTVYDHMANHNILCGFLKYETTYIYFLQQKWPFHRVCAVGFGFIFLSLDYFKPHSRTLFENVFSASLAVYHFASQKLLSPLPWDLR